MKKKPGVDLESVIDDSNAEALLRAIFGTNIMLNESNRLALLALASSNEEFKSLLMMKSRNQSQKRLFEKNAENQEAYQRRDKRHQITDLSAEKERYKRVADQILQDFLDLKASITTEEELSLYDSESVDLDRIQSVAMDKPRQGSKISNSLNDSRVFNDSFVNNFASSPHANQDSY